MSILVIHMHNFTEKIDIEFAAATKHFYAIGESQKCLLLLTLSKSGDAKQ